MSNTEALKIARDALADMIRAGKKAKVDLTIGIRDGDPVHPVSATLTWPLATAINSLTAIDALAQPTPQPAPTVPAAWIDSVMEQAQVFASAWSLVGGQFDNGNGLADAEAAKAELREMLAAAPQEPQR